MGRDIMSRPNNGGRLVLDLASAAHDPDPLGQPLRQHLLGF